MSFSPFLHNVSNLVGWWTCEPLLQNGKAPSDRLGRSRQQMMLETRKRKKDGADQADSSQVVLEGRDIVDERICIETQPLGRIYTAIWVTHGYHLIMNTIHSHDMFSEGNFGPFSENWISWT